MTNMKEVHLVFRDDCAKPLGAYLNKGTAQEFIEVLRKDVNKHPYCAGTCGDPVYTLVTVKVEDD